MYGQESIMIPITFPNYQLYSICSLTNHNCTKQYKGNETFRHKHKRDDNVGGSPNPWVTSTKPSHTVTFISLKMLQSATTLLPSFLSIEPHKLPLRKYF